MEERVQVAISPNPVKVSERVNADGDVVDPNTKEVIKKAE